MPKSSELMTLRAINPGRYGAIRAHRSAERVYRLDKNREIVVHPDDVDAILRQGGFEVVRKTRHEPGTKKDQAGSDDSTE